VQHDSALLAAEPPASIVPAAAIEDMIALARETPPGCFVELGVFMGGTAWHLARLAIRQDREIHLFDTFAGIPEAGAEDIEHHPGEFAADESQVRRAIPAAVFHVGQFPETMPRDLTDIAFVHVDCDQYASAIAAIEEFFPRMVPGGIMLFDDYGCTSGVTRAVNERFIDIFKLTAHGKAYVKC